MLGVRITFAASATVSRNIHKTTFGPFKIDMIHVKHIRLIQNVSKSVLLPTSVWILRNPTWPGYEMTTKCLRNAYEMPMMHVGACNIFTVTPKANAKCTTTLLSDGKVKCAMHHLIAIWLQFHLYSLSFSHWFGF